MITGFNTDVEFNGVTYHVQTEDKGLSRPVILSLVYDRGTILASKRVPYDDLIGSTFDEKLLADRLKKQHRLICAAIQAGRIDDLRRMSLRDASGDAAAPAAAPAAVAGHDNVDLFELPIPRPVSGSALEPPVFDNEIITITEGISVLDDVVLPAEAVEIVSQMGGSERVANTRLTIELLGEQRFVSGTNPAVTIMVCRGSGRKVVPKAQVMVKVLGSSFRPVIYHAATDENGLTRVDLEIPDFFEGRAAVMVRAISEGEEVELRRTIDHTA